MKSLVSPGCDLSSGGFVNKRSTEENLNDEVQSYLQHEIDAKIEAGVDPIEARRTALAEFGGVEQVKEVVRDNRTGAWFDSVLQDTLRLSHAASVARILVVGNRKPESGHCRDDLWLRIYQFAFVPAVSGDPATGGTCRAESYARLRREAALLVSHDADDYSGLRRG